MSKSYSIKANLELPYEISSIKKILSVGASIGIRYYEIHLSQSLFDFQISDKEATDYIVNIYPKEEEPSSVLSVYKREDFFLGFLKANKNKVMVMITITGPKEKDFKNKIYSEIDFYFYIEILLKICNNFKIETFELEITD